MKSDIKLIFKDNNNLKLFSIKLFNYLSTYKTLLKKCDYHNIKNNMYIDTQGYANVKAFINNNSKKYDYEVIIR